MNSNDEKKSLYNDEITSSKENKTLLKSLRQDPSYTF